jgi:predicted DNA-binding protein (MmcQ/YjbR family)
MARASRNQRVGRTTRAQWHAKIRALCLSLPGTVEKSSWGHPNFAAGCIYAALDDYGGRPSLCVLSTKPEQSRRVAGESKTGDPETARCFVPPFVGGKGWIGIWLDRAPPWSLVRTLVRAAHALSVAGRKPARARG